MRIYLAPMEGVIDHHLRGIFATIGGIDLFTTEFVRVTEHVLPRKVFLRYCPELAQDPLHDTEGSTPTRNVKPKTRVQLLGSNPLMLAKNAAKAARLGAIGIDLNFGCPAKTVNRHKGGACLLDDTPLIHEIVQAVRAALPASVPLSVKIRLGYESRDSGLRNALAIEQAGANELVVHARSKADAYKPPAYWNEIAEIKGALAIPVVANGEIWTTDDFLRCREQSTCEHIMLGRGMLAQPDLALQVRALVNNQPIAPVSWEAVSSWLAHFFLQTNGHYPKKFSGNRVKQWLHYLKRRYPEADILFEKIKRVRDEKTLAQALGCL